MILLTNNEGTVGAPTTARLLAEGRPALDAIEAGIRLIEADPNVRTVGRGGWPNLLGEVELDACMMDGTTLRTGAIGALKGFLHPVSVAHELMRRLPHELAGGRRRRTLRPRDRRRTGGKPDRILPPRLAGLVRERSDPPPIARAGRTLRWPPCAAMPSTPKSAATPLSFWRTIAAATSARAPAPRAGRGNIPVGSATARSSAPARTPTRATAPPPAPGPAK